MNESFRERVANSRNTKGERAVDQKPRWYNALSRLIMGDRSPKKRNRKTTSYR